MFSKIKDVIRNKKYVTFIGLTSDETLQNPIHESVSTIGTTVRYFNSSGNLNEKKIDTIYHIPINSNFIYLHVHVPKESTVRVTLVNFIKTVYVEQKQILTVPINLSRIDISNPSILRVDIKFKNDRVNRDYIVQKIE